MEDGCITLRNKHIGLILAILTILSICASAVIAYAITNETAKHNQEDIKELKTDVNNIQSELSELKVQTKAITIISEDIKVIKQDVKDIIKGEYSQDGINNWRENWPWIKLLRR